MRSESISISHDGWDIEILPAVGAGIGLCRYRGIDLLRPAGRPLPLDPLELGSFLLAPFSGRIEGGTFRFGEKTVRLEPNLAGEPHPLHGQAWLAPWTVESIHTNGATFSFVHAPGSWPWRYECKQQIRLVGNQMTLELTLVNRAPEPMPAGLGLHPYFPAPDEALLSAEVTAVWMTNETGIPLSRAAVPAAWRFADHRLVRELNVDNCFEGWSGEASLRWPERGVALEMTASPELRRLVVYCPPGKDFFCVEPVSHATNAVNLHHLSASEMGLVVLQPEDALSATVTFSAHLL